MKLLLDTHIFLWYISGDERLSTAMRQAIQDVENEVYLSVVSLWEVAIKHQLGKLPLPSAPGTYLPTQREKHHIASLPLNEVSIVHLPELPLLHRDPFDRMLICQALAHQLTIVSVDDFIQAYNVSIWHH